MCVGMAYLMTPDLPKLLYNKAKQTPFFRLDDVYVLGLLANKVSANHVDIGVRSANLVSRKEKENRFSSGKLLFAVTDNLEHFRSLWRLLTARHRSFFGNATQTVP